MALLNGGASVLAGLGAAYCGMAIAARLLRRRYSNGTARASNQGERL
jgi:hypothetical protein